MNTKKIQKLMKLKYNYPDPNDEQLQTKIYKTLSNNGYILLSKTMLSSIYVQKEFMKNNDTPYFDNRLRA